MRKAPAVAMAAVVALSGCGKKTVVAPPPVQIAGQWEFVTKSFLTNNTYAIIEANLSQAEDAISANAKNVLVLDGTADADDPLFAIIDGLGGPCDQQVLGDVALDGTLSAGPTFAFTLTDTGPLGTAVVNGTALLNSGGTAVVNGSYLTPPGCGFNQDSGGITLGALIQPFSGMFSGMLNGGHDQITATLAQDENLNLTITGTDNGGAFTLMGAVIGGAFQASGTVNGQDVSWIGVFDPDPTQGDFLIYDSAAHFLGQLNPGMTPAAAVKRPPGIRVER